MNVLKIGFLLLSLVASGCGAAYAPSREGGARPAASMAKIPTDRKFRRDAWLTLEVDDEDKMRPTLEEIEGLAKKFKGYVVKSSHQSITIKVPTAKTETVIDEIAKLGELTKRDLSTRDVTAQYFDTELRIKTLRALRDRMQALLDKADTVKELLAIEKELSRITGKLEALEAQMRQLSGQTAFGTINVKLEESVSPGPLGWIPYGLYLGVKWLIVWD